MQEVVENERQRASSLIEQLNGAKNAINELARENNEKERLIRSLQGTVEVQEKTIAEIESRIEEVNRM
jgi:chromosome segregation ATPase